MKRGFENKVIYPPWGGPPRLGSPILAKIGQYLGVFLARRGAPAAKKGQKRLMAEGRARFASLCYAPVGGLAHPDREGKGATQVR